MLSRVDFVAHGDPFEMGLAQGGRLRQRILAAREALAHIEVFRLRQPAWMPYLAYRRWAERRAAALLHPPLTRDFPRMLERLEGMAEGACLGWPSLALMNALEAFMSSVRDRVREPAPIAACSAVAVRGSRSASGEAVISRNFDYIPVAQPFYALRESRPRGALRSLDFTVAPLAGAVDGVNEKGLAMTYNYGYTVETPAPTGTLTMAIQEALETCATVEEAARRLMERPRWGGGLLMLADASGDVASLEISSSRARLRRPRPGEDLIFHTNAYQSDELRAVEVPRDAVHSERAPRGLRGKRVLESAERRYKRLGDLLREGGALGPEDLLKVMSDHGGEKPSDNTVCVHGAYWTTTACLQLFPKRRCLRVSDTTACRARLREFGL